MAAKMTQDQIERILLDLRNEPAWRTEAQRECDFYDGLQLHQETLTRMSEIGIPPIIVNLIKPSIDAVIGLEAKTRSDLIVKSESDEGVDVAKAINEKMKEVTRTISFNRATADAFGYQTKVGIGWVEVSRESDPFKSPYRVESIDRNEMWWDWRARKPDLEDARYIVRRKWYDTDELVTVFPDKKELIAQSMSQRPLWEGVENYDEQLARSWEIEQSTHLQSAEWRDSERGRLALYEVWYKVFDTAEVMFLPDGRVVEFDKNNEVHVIVKSNGIKTEKRRITRIRTAYYLGPHQIADRASPYLHNRFPYVPFFGYREDRSKSPYGLIRSMKSPQEEVNARRSKMLYNLSTRRVIADKDAVDDHSATAREVARSDAYIITNPERLKDGGFKIESDVGLNQQQFQLLQESKSNIQEASGIFREMMGRSAGSGQSGEAIKNLIDQSTQVLGEIMDNYRDGRKLAGELLLSLVVEDLQGVDNLKVPVEVMPGSKEKQTVVLNQLVSDAHGNKYRTNDVARSRMKVALDEIPSTPTYRTQLLSQMMNMTASLPPQMQAAIVDMIFMSSDLPNRHEIAERLQKVNGMGSDQSANEAANAQQQKMLEMQQQIEQMTAQLESAKTKAQISEIYAKTEKLLAEAEKAKAEKDKISVDLGIAIDSHDMSVSNHNNEHDNAIAMQNAMPVSQY